MTVIIIAGFGGSGKTLFGSILTLALYRNNYEIISNVKSLKIPHIDFNSDFINEMNRIKKLKTEDRHKEKRKLVFVDEIQNYIDSREASSNRNKAITQNIFQIRKMKMDLIATLQDYSSMDIRLRRITEKIILPKFNEDNYSLYYVVLNNQWQFLYENTIFINPILFDLYDTYEDIEDEIDLSKDKRYVNKMIKKKGYALQDV